MTTRQFDPVFSAALRNELEALAERADAAPAAAPHRPHRAPLRSQVWISVAVALALVVATLGVLRLTAPHVPPADHGPAVVSPLTRITDPRSPGYVARSVATLLNARGTGSGTRTFDVPGGVTSLTVYLNCSGSAKYEVELDGRGSMSSSCDLSLIHI